MLLDRPADALRRNRVVAVVTDAEFKKIRKIAEAREQAVGTLAYEVLTRWLNRQN